MDLGLDQEDFNEGKNPEGWKLRLALGKRGSAQWVVEEDGVSAVKLQSNAALTFLGKKVSIDIREYPIVSWKWNVDDILEGVDESSPKGDDHPIRI